MNSMRRKTREDREVEEVGRAGVHECTWLRMKVLIMTHMAEAKAKVEGEKKKEKSEKEKMHEERNNTNYKIFKKLIKTSLLWIL